MNFNHDNHQQAQNATTVKLEKAIKDNQSNCPSAKNTIGASSKKISTCCRTTPVKVCCIDMHVKCKLYHPRTESEYLD